MRFTILVRWWCAVPGCREFIERPADVQMDRNSEGMLVYQMRYASDARGGSYNLNDIASRRIPQPWSVVNDAPVCPAHPLPEVKS